MSAAERAVAEARGWIGTPYHHQASAKGAGTDCLGLLRGVWRALYGTEPEAVPPYTPDWAEPQGEERLMAAALRHMERVSSKEMCSGDVLLFRMKRGAVAKHVGLVSDTGPNARFIHAYTGHGVTESALTEPWSRKVAAVFRLPEEI